MFLKSPYLLEINTKYLQIKWCVWNFGNSLSEITTENGKLGGGQDKTRKATCWNYWVTDALRFIQLSFLLWDRFPISHNTQLSYQISIWGRKQSIDMFNLSLTKRQDFGWVNSAEPVSFSVKWSWWRWNENTPGQGWAQCLAKSGHSKGASPPPHSFPHHHRCRQQAGGT